jgi:hypothetical protein
MCGDTAIRPELEAIRTRQRRPPYVENDPQETSQRRQHFPTSDGHDLYEKLNFNFIPDIAPIA